MRPASARSAGRRRVNRRPAALVAGLLALAGCGSTVQQVGSAPTGTVGQGLGVPTSAPGVVPGTVLPGTGTTVPGSQPGSVPGGSGATLPPGSTGSVPPGTHTVAGVPQGVGVTPTKIYVGIGYETNGDAANAALGATGISQGDPQADAKAVVADINAHGGIAGRKLVPVWWATNAESTQTYAQMDQQACAHYTQDNHVFAVMDKGLTDNFLACVEKAGAMNFNSGTIIYPDQTLLKQYPYYFEDGTMTTDRVFAQMPRTFATMGYYNGWDANLGRASQTTPTKIGVLTIGFPEWSRPLYKYLLPELKAQGHPVASNDIVTVNPPQSTAGEDQVVNAISAAELRFRQDGVNHVILLDATGTLLIFFSRAAQGQHYFPRYGLNSGAGAQTLASAHDVPTAQLNGMIALGWSPDLDLTPKAAAPYEPAAMKTCLDMIDRRTGQKLAGSPNAAGIALSYCDTLYLLKWGIEHAGPSITRDTVRAALERTGVSYPSVGFLQDFFGPTRHDGPELGWNLAWDGSCTCARYVGKAFQVPNV